VTVINNGLMASPHFGYLVYWLVPYVAYVFCELVLWVCKFGFDALYNLTKYTSKWLLLLITVMY